MKKIDRYKLFNNLSAPLSLSIFFIILYIYPGIVKTNEEYRYLFIWLAVISVGGMLINKRYYALIEKIKPPEKIEEFLTRKGRVKLRTDPLYFLTQEQFTEYKKWQRFTVIFFAGVTLLLFAVLRLPEYF